MPKFIDLTGQRFGRFTVLERTENQGKEVSWLCRCDCGNVKRVRGKDLKNGNTKSCGCYKKDKIIKMNTTHGKKNTRLYTIWCGMKQRCYDKNSSHYCIYGGKGITICDEWRNDFKAFYDWAIANGYADNLTLDRVDNDKSYSPDNCRWATYKEQANHTKRNRIVEYKGEKKTLAEWCEELGMNYGTVITRILDGWSIKKAFETPIRKLNQDK